ncbi:MAG: hypothetical protein Q8Q15_00560 [bacterium]|nr:hypothetical protein [bacterium]
MKKLLPVIIVIIIALAGVFYVATGSQKPETPKEETVKETVLPIGERPYVSLTPRDDGHELTMEITGIVDVDTVEYELVYLAEGVSRGGVGSGDLKGGSSFTRKVLFGTCSKNVCRYDEGVTGGTLTLRFRGKSGTQKYEVPFLLNSGGKTQNRLVLPDGSFQFEGTLSSKTFYVTLSTIGLPKNPEGKIVGGPYGLFTSGSKTVKGTVKIRLDEASPNAKMLGWDSKTSSWTEITEKFETDGQTVSVNIDRLTTFIVVSP